MSCGFMQYHVRHDYRNVRDEPRTCSGLYPPPGIAPNAVSGDDSARDATETQEATR